MSSRIADIPVPPEYGDMIRTGALVAVNTSGGKDSQAMTILLSRIVLHAPLGEVEWQCTVSHTQATLPGGVPLIMAPVSSGKSLLDQVEERWPAPDEWSTDRRHVRGLRSRADPSTARKCPRCGRDMVLRTARQGPNAGGRFWGCAGYPVCRAKQEAT